MPYFKYIRYFTPTGLSFLGLLFFYKYCRGAAAEKLQSSKIFVEIKGRIKQSCRAAEYFKGYWVTGFF
jgi:hypothetical protein